MAFLPSLSDNPVLMNVLKAFPHAAIPLLEQHEVLLRGPSPLSPGQRELIAAYVSGLNGCRYCLAIHTATAVEFGYEKDLVARLLEAIEGSGVEQKMVSILNYVCKLTKSPDSLTQQDADKVYAAGWDERALHDAVSVCALFNYMNRFVEGLGVEADEAYLKMAARRLKTGGYRELLAMLGSK